MNFHRFTGLFLLTLASAFLAGEAARGASAEEECSRLAGDAVALKDIEPASAVASCSKAVGAAPGAARLQYFYARALQRAGRPDEARAMYQWASDAGIAEAGESLAQLDVTKGATGDDAAQRDKLAGQLDAIAGIAERASETASRSYDDPIVVLAITGSEPRAVMQWVSTNTRLVPYSGMLRGAPGVLMDRSGNSLDRALLLADLLRRAGHDVRIARATLTPGQTAKLREQFLHDVRMAERSTAVDPDKEFLRLAVDSRLEPSLIESSARDATREAEEYEAAVTGLFGKVLPGVTQTVGARPSDSEPLLEDAARHLGDYFWVQRRTASGWDDLVLDPVLGTELKVTDSFALDQIPADLVHRVTIRLSVETWSAGRLSETPLIEKTWVAADLAGRSFTLAHQMYPTIDPDELAAQSNPLEAFRKSLLQTAVVSPVLRIGAETLSDKLFAMDGRVLPASTQTLAQLGFGQSAEFGKLSSGVAAAFGDKDKPVGVVDASKSDTVITAEWLDFELTAPGHAPTHLRRSVFDLIGAAMRVQSLEQRPVLTDAKRQQRAAALAGTVDGLVFTATPASDWLVRTGGEDLRRTAKYVASVVRSAHKFSDVGAKAPPARSDTALWTWAAERAGPPQLPIPVPVVPNIVLLWQTLNLERDSEPVQQYAFDIVSNQTVSNLDFSTQVAQGVFDTVVEHEIVRSNQVGGNAASLHAEDLANGNAWVRLDPSRVDLMTKLRLPADTQAFIESRLRKGFTVIAPNGAAGATAETLAFWLIDPRTGTTLGLGSTGMGTAQAEYSALLPWLTWSGFCMGWIVSNAILGPANHPKYGVAHLALCVVSPPLASLAILKKMGALPGVIAAFNKTMFNAF